MILLLSFVFLLTREGILATVTYHPSPIATDGQNCPSDEAIAEVLLEIQNAIEMDNEPISDSDLTLALNGTVSVLTNQITDILQEVTNTSQALELAMSEIQNLRQDVATLSEVNNTLQAFNETLSQLGQEILNLRQEIGQISGDPCPVLVGLSQQLPAESCKEIFENTPDLPSDFYWIGSSNETAVRLYCDMERVCCNSTSGGWTRTAFLNMSDSEDQCPPAWNEIASPRTCGRTTMFTGCDSAMFSSHGISYSQVCGRVIAYQFCRTDAFIVYNLDPATTIDEVYVEGISITHGNPRQHVWTFAAARQEDWGGSGQIICPCTNSNNPAVFLVPPYVGNDYFCETGTPTAPPPTCNLVTGEGFYSDDPLWDGENCGQTSTCCGFNNPPWFCKELPEPVPTTDDIEVRICVRGSMDTEEIPVELVEIYIR